MNTLIHRFSLNHLVLFLAGIPILISLSLAVELVLNYRTTLENANRDKSATELILLYDNLAHNLAVERGLSAGVLGSKGNPEQVKALIAHRKKADHHVQKLMPFSDDTLPRPWQTKLKSDVANELAKLNEVRRQVDTLSPKLSPFGYHSNLNQLSIDNASIISGELSNP